MTTTSTGLGGSWRLAEPADAPFLYELIAAIEPRWWRFSRHGIHPELVLRVISGVSAGAIVSDDHGRPIGAAALAEVSGASGTAMFEIHALPGREGQVAAHAPSIVGAALDGAPIRRLYHERFDGDPDLRGATSPLWVEEVVMPEFTLIEGVYEARTTWALEPRAFRAARDEGRL